MTVGTDLRAEILALFVGGSGEPAYGRTLTMGRITPGAYDPETGATAASTPSSQAGKGKIGDYDDKVIDGTLIRTGDRLCTFLPDDAAFRPAVGDSVVDGADTYTVVSIKQRELGGDWIAFTLQVRR